MAGWIALGIVVLAILVLLAVVGGLLGRLSELDRISRRVQTQQRDKAAALQAAVVPMQESLERLNLRVATTQQRMAVVKDRLATLRSTPSPP